MLPQIYARTSLTPSAETATDDTLVFAYPAGTAQGDFVAGEERLHVDGLNNTLEQAADTFTVAYNAGNITVTYKDATTIPAGTRVVFEGQTSDLSDLDTGTATTADIAAKVNTILAIVKGRSLV